MQLQHPGLLTTSLIGQHSMTSRFLEGVHIVSLIGQQGTGKTSLGLLLSKLLNRQFIEASEVVTRTTGVSHRADMPSTNGRTKTDRFWLAEAIVDEIRSDTVLSGVREKEVHEGLLSYGAALDIFELWCPANERYVRVKHNEKVEHYKDFVSHGQAELDIGLQYLLDQDNPLFITTYWELEETADQIVAYINSKNSR